MLYIHNAVRFRQSGTTMQKTLPACEVARRAAVRRVYPGFPAEPFKAEEEVAAYTSGDTICCLMCGRHFKSLGGHLLKVHNIDTKDYRARFNIPWRYSLEASDLCEARRQRGLRPVNRERIRKLGQTCRSTGYRPRCQMGQKAIEEGRRGTYGGYKHDDFSWHLEQVRTVFGRPRPPEGLASWNTFKKRRAVNPDLQAAYLNARAARPVHKRTTRRRRKRAELS